MITSPDCADTDFKFEEFWLTRQLPGYLFLKNRGYFKCKKVLKFMAKFNKKNKSPYKDRIFIFKKTKMMIHIFTKSLKNKMSPVTRGVR